MPDEVLPDGVSPNNRLTIADTAQIAREINEKANHDRTASGVTFGTVVSVSSVVGEPTYVSVRVAGDPPGSLPIVATAFAGMRLAEGATVALLWDNPHGCYIIGTLDPIPTPTARMSLLCSKSYGFNAEPQTVASGGAGWTTVSYCCAQYETDGADVLGLQADAHISVPIDGVYAIDAQVPYSRSSGGPLGLGLVEAQFLLTDKDGALLNAYPSYGKCLTNYGTISLPTQYPLKAGDTVRVQVRNSSGSTIELSNTGYCAVAWLAPYPTEVFSCGGSPDDPAPSEGALSTITTDDLGYHDEGADPDGATFSAEWIVPVDGVITTFAFVDRSPQVDPPEFPNLTLYRNGSFMPDPIPPGIVEIDSGDILPGEFPSVWTDPIPVTAGDVIQFGVRETGGAKGYFTFNVGGYSTTLGWL